MSHLKQRLEMRVFLVGVMSFEFGEHIFECQSGHMIRLFLHLELVDLVQEPARLLYPGYRHTHCNDNLDSWRL